MHGDLNASTNIENSYNPITSKVLNEKGFNYIALGHIHKPNSYNNIVYPGSTFPQGFDELGPRGMIVGEIEKTNSKIVLKKEFKQLNEIIFTEKKIDITNINSKEELIESINELEIKEKELVKVLIIGKRNFEIDNYDLYKLIEKENIIKIKDKTQVNYNIEELANTYSLKGIYIQEIQKELEKARNRRRKKGFRRSNWTRPSSIKIEGEKFWK